MMEMGFKFISLVFICKLLFLNNLSVIIKLKDVVTMINKYFKTLHNTLKHTSTQCRRIKRANYFVFGLFIEIKIT